MAPIIKPVLPIKISRFETKMVIVIILRVDLHYTELQQHVKQELLPLSIWIDLLCITVHL